MKVKISAKVLQECIANAIDRVINEKKGGHKHGFEKASKSANRDIEREIYGDGFKSYDKPHKSKKDYKREKFDIKKWQDDGKLDENLNEYRFQMASPFDDAAADNRDPYEIIDDEADAVVNGNAYRDVSKLFNFDDEKEAPTITLVTNIEEQERDFINKVLEEFEDAELDFINGEVSFIIPRSKAGQLSRFLTNNDVEIKQKIKNN